MNLRKRFDNLASRFAFEGIKELVKEGNLYMYTDGGPRDQILILGTKDDDIKDLLDLAGEIMNEEEYGFIDLDGVVVNIEVGNNFHGIPEDIRLNLKIEDVDILEEFFTWAKIQWTDWAS